MMKKILTIINLMMILPLMVGALLLIQKLMLGDLLSIRQHLSLQLQILECLFPPACATHLHDDHGDQEQTECHSTSPDPMQIDPPVHSIQAPSNDSGKASLTLLDAVAHAHLLSVASDHSP